MVYRGEMVEGDNSVVLFRMAVVRRQGEEEVRMADGSQSETVVARTERMTTGDEEDDVAALEKEEDSLDIVVGSKSV